MSELVAALHTIEVLLGLIFTNLVALTIGYLYYGRWRQLPPPACGYLKRGSEDE